MHLQLRISGINEHRSGQKISSYLPLATGEFPKHVAKTRIDVLVKLASKIFIVSIDYFHQICVQVLPQLLVNLSPDLLIYFVVVNDVAVGPKYN